MSTAQFPIYAFSYVSPEGKPCAHAPESAVPCTGLVLLKQVDADNCEIDYDVKGLAAGNHGFHIHEKADFSNGCVSAGPHYNPFGKTHGGPSDEVRHVGDLGNISPNESGVAKGRIVDSLVKLFGEHTVVGRSFMVHADADDLGKGGHDLSATTGNAGARIACGAIKTFPIRATCKVTPQGKPCHDGAEQAPECQGVIDLVQETPDVCVISYEVTGLTAGKHGFHIHEKADFSNGCVSAGPHYNPFGKTHGGPSDEVRHVGDLGNIEPDSNGVAKGQITDSLVKLFGEHSVVGRSFMVHADADDLGKGGHELSPTTGNAGARIACGEIKLVD